MMMMINIAIPYHIICVRFGFICATSTRLGEKLPISLHRISNYGLYALNRYTCKAHLSNHTGLALSYVSPNENTRRWMNLAD